MNTESPPIPQADIQLSDDQVVGLLVVEGYTYTEANTKLQLSKLLTEINQVTSCGATLRRQITDKIQETLHVLSAIVDSRRIQIALMSAAKTL